MNRITALLKRFLPQALRAKVVSMMYFLFPYATHVFIIRRGWINRPVTDTDDHLRRYWEDRESPNRKRLIEIISREASLRPTSERIALLEYGSHVGINIRLLRDSPAPLAKADYYAVEPNLHAFRFLKAQMPDVMALNGEDDQFITAQNFPARRIDISFANSVFYSMEYSRVFSVCKKLGAISRTIVIGDEVANIDGDRTRLIDAIDSRGNSYSTLAHPFRAILRDCGFCDIETLPAAQPQLSLTGYIIARQRELC